MIRFGGGYQLDPVQGLTRDAAEVRVTPKSLQVLQVLAARAGQVVTKDELFREVWANTAVSDTALTSCIQELRHALDDDAKHPRFIETLHRRGYRFLPKTVVAAARPLPAPGAASPALPGVVGREAIIERLLEAAARAGTGTRQVLFITGEPGVGKTTVVQTFLSRLRGLGAVRTAWGQCVEHYGVGEPYQPVLEAITRLCHHADGNDVVATLERHAPSWLAQLPGLVPAERLAAFQRTAAGTTRDRMLRELTGAIETMTARRLLVLWLDDLHWCDASTIDWIAGFAQRPETARVLLVGSFRRSALRDRREPLAAVTDALQVKGHAQEIPLDGLDEEAVAEYVALRFPAAAGQAGALRRLAGRVQRHTGGNPLFVVNVLGDLVARDLLRPAAEGWDVNGDVETLDLGVPDDVRRVVERQVDRLAPDERALLEVASVAGAAFSTAAVAAAARREAGEVEAVFGALARERHFVRLAGVAAWPDGTVATRVEFVHALYREVLYRSVPPGRRAELHRCVATCQAAAYGDRAPEIAAELAMHFERGHDTTPAVIYLQHAADNARRRCAYLEARSHVDAALALLATQPPGAERTERELMLWIARGGAVMATEGWGSADAEHAFSRARALCHHLGETPRLFPARWGLWLFYWGRSQLALAHDVARDLLAIAGVQGDPALLLQAHHAMWATAFSQGRLADARAHADEGLRVYDAREHAGTAATYGSHDAGVCALQFKARALALAGETDLALAAIADALALSRELGHPFTEALTLVFAAAVHQTLRDGPATRRHAAAAVALAREQGFRLVHAWGMALEGWAVADAGEVAAGARQIAEGLAAMRATGSGSFLPHFLSLRAEACLLDGRGADGLAALDEAMAISRQTGEGFYDAELHRLDGELRLAAGPDARRAEASFRTAIAIATTQGARLLADRAARSLAKR